MKSWRVARVLVLLAWLVAAGMSWWTAPRQAHYEQATAAVRDGEAVAYGWGDYWEDDTDRWFQPPALRSSGTAGPYFAWRTGDHRIFWTDTQEADGIVAPATGGDVGPATRTVSAVEYTGPAAAELARQLDQQQLAGASISGRPLVGWILLALSLTVLSGLIFGPAPRRGTRWYWFWIIVVTPHALGLVLWVIREHPWAQVERPAATDRDRGWFGLVTALVASFVLSVVLLGLNHLLGDRWVPV